MTPEPDAATQPTRSVTANGSDGGTTRTPAASTLRATGEAATPPVATAPEIVDLPSLQTIGQTPLLPPREPLGARLAGLIGRHHTLLLTLCIVLLWAISTLPTMWSGTTYEPGMVAPEDIVVPRDAWLPNHDVTEARRQEAASLVQPVPVPNPAAQGQALRQLNTILSMLRVVRKSSDKNSDQQRQKDMKKDMKKAQAALVQRFNQQLTEPLSPEVAASLLALPAQRLETVHRAAENAVRDIYVNVQIRSDPNHKKDDLRTAYPRIDQAIQKVRAGLELSPGEAKVAGALARHVAHWPNMVENKKQTELARQAAREAVHEVYEKIKAGDPLIRAGEEITEEKWGQLQELELPGFASRLDLETALARLGLCVVLVVFAASYVLRFQPRLIDQPASLWLTAMVPILFLLLFRSIKGVPHADFMMVPLAATTAMLLTVLLNARIGLVAGFIVAALCAVMARADIGLLLVALLSAWIGTLSVADLVSRSQLVRAAAVLSLTNAVLIASQSVLGNTPIDEVISSAGTGALAGVGSILATAGLAVLLERPFGITSHLQLLELMSPDELVMRRMQAEAPGTYTHSLMVATLSEAAAKVVGADPLLCRVGGLYHDIGKLRRPHCFVENQSGENIHDRLSPQLSALIILAHVKDGLELGRALRLPQPVLEIIAQHHGTTLLSYFYVRAVQNNLEHDATNGATSGEGSRALPDEKMFRYAGPRPQSKEAAIVMLADTIEASSRALPNLTPERLHEHIKTMITQRLQEGELSECELTLRDLGTIEHTFTHVLRGVLHHRIEYPEPGRELDTQTHEDARDWMQETLTDSRTEPVERRHRERRHNG
ncbi:MAG: HDIG domain-containing protein, partial [Armatimonadota bacterium]|nr:HDIG domain-containing protein [Armatimonadota bacterium]